MTSDDRDTGANVVVAMTEDQKELLLLAMRHPGFWGTIRGMASTVTAFLVAAQGDDA